MSEETDFSNAFEKIQQMFSNPEGQQQIQNILGMFGDNAQEPESSNESAPQSGNSGFDSSNIDLFMKMQKAMAIMQNQKNNANVEFLKTLKPFLKKDRRSKVDQAVQLMGMAKAMEIFKNMNNEGGG